jgi:hypothetical protein
LKRTSTRAISKSREVLFEQFGRFRATPAQRGLAVLQCFQAKCLRNESAAVRSDGKDLEALVALIEKLHLPEGFKISPNQRVYNEQGTQIAELDVWLKGDWAPLI